ncbi:MAG: sensor histidine kinase [Lachnospiraceae bacterium]
MKKGSLKKKLVLTNLVCVLTYFLLANIPFKMFMTSKAEESFVNDLKDSGYYMVDEYVTAAANGEEITQDKFEKLLKTADHYTGFRYWVVKTDGEIIIDTGTDSAKGVNVTHIQADYLDQTVLKHRKLEGLIDYDCISVICPMNYDYTIRGYLVLHGNYTSISDSIEDTMFWVNIAGVMVSLIMMMVAICNSFYYTKVINRLIELTVSYTDGKFDDRMNMKLLDEHQKLANAIVCLAEKTEGLIEYQKNFIANVSHDFRSPLTSIKGYTEAMKEGIIPPEAQGKYLDIILFETERLTGLTQSLLQLNEFDNKGVKLVMSKFNICQMIKQSAATFEAKCAEKKLKIRLVLAEREIWVQADKSKIQQVLHNLIDNAIKFSNDDNLIVITVSEKDDKVFVSVRDYGIGIPRASLSQVWERFYKTDLSRGKDKKGTGLGLSITKQIINAHEENITVDSVVGEGTEFKFSLKRVEKP